ncbi:MAG: hypothetical protein HUK19_02575 [Fibrobacter sp.]|nr:hypothetical protein [Fibrobacter sp.]
MVKLKRTFVALCKQNLKISHFVVLALILGLGIFNAITGVRPYIKQHNRERNIVETFDQWWNDVGAGQFSSVGLQPTEQIKSEEFERYREKYLAQNPSFIIEDRLPEMRQQFRNWWELEGGKIAYTQKHKKFMPTEDDFNREQEKWINKYTDNFVRYSFAFVPKRAQYERLFTSWLLFPSGFSFAIFAVFFFFAFYRMYPRWKIYITAGLIVLFAVGGGILVEILCSTSFFDHYSAERYMGMSLALCFLLGAAAFAPKRELAPQLVTVVSFVGLFLDMFVNWCVNPGLFSAVAILSPVCFGLGAFAGLKIETRRKTSSELQAEAIAERLRNNIQRNPMAERKAKTRKLVDDGFAKLKAGEMETAHRLLSQAISSLLQEHPVDKLAVKALVDRLMGPKVFIEFSSTQWLEWGEIAKTKNAPEAAVMLLKKGLSIEKDPNFARRALYTLGEICVNNKIELQDGINRLKKVIAMNDSDMMAKQAKRMLKALETKNSDEVK